MAHKWLKWLTPLASHGRSEIITNISKTAHNHSLKPTVTRVMHFAEIAKFEPRYGG